MEEKNSNLIFPAFLFDAHIATVEYLYYAYNKIRKIL